MISKIDTYRDGGTLTFYVDDIAYSIDFRANTETKGELYWGAHPTKGLLVTDVSEIAYVMRQVNDNLKEFNLHHKNLLITWLFTVHAKFLP